MTIGYRIMLTCDGVREPHSQELPFATSKAAEDECRALNASLVATPKMKWVVVEDVQDGAESHRRKAQSGFGSRRR
jgi:hypothetical protein